MDRPLQEQGARYDGRRVLNGQIQTKIKDKEGNSIIFLYFDIALGSSIQVLFKQNAPPIQIRVQGATLIVTGNTFPIKDDLKSLNGIWIPSRRLMV